VLLTRLTDTPVRGVSLRNVSLLRLDLTGGLAPGNKHFKLQGNVAAARRQGVRRLVSFGGAWSNHLHALAAVGAEQGFATVGIVRGDEQVADSAMLADARNWGMDIVRVSRAEYRRRHQPEYLQHLARRFAPCLVIPEGGGNREGALGCMDIAALLREQAPGIRQVLLPVGTGTTLAGVAAGLGRDYQLYGVAALKGADDLDRRVASTLAQLGAGELADWRILQDDHCGGFARVSPGLREFILAFEGSQGIPLEPVYTGKMLYALYRRLQRGEWDPGEPRLAIHTGGLQGRRGFSWLDPGPL